MQTRPTTYFVLIADKNNTNGVAKPSADAIVQELKDRHIAADQIVTADHLPDLVARAETSSAPHKALVVPGGGALTMAGRLGKTPSEVKALGTRVNTFVRHGGAYIGVCAGAILGTNQLHWQQLHRKQLPADEDWVTAYDAPDQSSEAFMREIKYEGLEGAIGKPQQAQMLGLAAGAMAHATPYAAHWGQSIEAAVSNIIPAPIKLQDASEVPVAYIAGPKLELPKDSNATVMGVFAGLPKAPPAIIRQSVGKGEVTLSAVHPETPLTAPVGTSQQAREAQRAQLFDLIFGT